MLLQRWQRGVLTSAGLVFLASALGLLALAYRALLGWFDMARDVAESGFIPLPAVHALPHVTLLSTMTALSVLTGLAALVSKKWFEEPPSRLQLQRRLTSLLWGLRLVTLLGPLLLLGTWLYSIAIPNPNSNWMMTPLADGYEVPTLNLTMILMSLGFFVCGGPLVALSWFGLGHWLTWTRRVSRRGGEASEDGTLHRLFLRARPLLTGGGVTMLGLFVWLLLPASLQLYTGYPRLEVQQLFADQKQIVFRVFELQLLFGGLMLLTWRRASEQVCHEIEPQDQRLAEYLHRAALAHRGRPRAALFVVACP